MYTVILAIIITSVIMFVKQYYEFGGDFLGDTIFFSLFFGAILGGVIGGAIALSLPMHYRVDVWSEKLVSLQDNSTIKGSFFLGSGEFNGSMKYVFYVKNKDSTFAMWQVDYVDARIKYSDTQPTETVTKRHPDDSFWNHFALDLNSTTYDYVFEVPRGTIKNNYTLDAQ